MVTRLTPALLATLAAVSAAVLAVDLLQSPGLAAAVGYVAVVWIATRARSPRLVRGVAAYCTLLTFVGLLFSARTGDPWQATGNAAFAVFAIWLTVRLHLGRRHGEEDVRRSLDGAPTAFLTVRDSGEIVYANREAERLFGYTCDELLGCSVDVLVPARFRDGHPALRARFVRRPSARRLGEGRDLYAVRRDGSEFAVEIALSPFHRVDGLFVLAAIVDVSERRRAERTRARLASIVNSSDDAIIGKDLDGTITSWNPAAEALYGYSEEEAVGRSVLMLVPEDRLDEVSAYLRRIAHGESVDHYETVRIRKDGSFVVVSLALSPIRDPDGQIVGVSTIARDISERRKAERDLAARTRALTSANRALERSNQDLRDFAHVVSHDLKAPLRHIATLATWVHEDERERLDERGRAHLDELVDRVKWMDALIDGILTYSRAGRSEPDLRSIDTQQLALECVDALCPPEGVRVRIDGSLPVVRFDEAQLLQVFQNLIGNAIAHLGKPTGEIVVSCAESDDAWEFSVRDDGVGIASRDLDRIFKLFQTVGARDEARSTGIGLAVVKRIVERNGGRVSVSSSPGEGADFRFTISKATDPRDPGSEDEKTDEE